MTSSRAWLLAAGVVGTLLVATTGNAAILDVFWTAPVTNVDGSPLTDLASYRVYYGVSNPPCPGSSVVQVPSAAPTPKAGDAATVRLTGLTTGTPYYVSVTAVDEGGNESACVPAVSAVARDTSGGRTGSPPTTPTLSASLASQETVTGTWSGITSPTPNDWIALYAQGSGDTDNLALVYVSCVQIPGAARAAGSCNIPVPSGLAPGAYELRLFADNSFTRLATSESFIITAAPPPTTSLSVSPSPVGSWRRVTATWDGIVSPTPTDWIGLYTPGSADTDLLAWIYVSCGQTAVAASGAGSCRFQGLPPGTYELRLFANDSYTLLATSNSLKVTQ
jgi:hypothetical protein